MGITLQLRSALEKTSIYISAMNKDEQDIHSYVGAALYHIFVLIICYRYRTSTPTFVAIDSTDFPSSNSDSIKQLPFAV